VTAGKSSTPRPFWARGGLWLGLALLSALPFVLTPLPVMPDHFAHLARYHVMLNHADSSFLQTYFSLEWHPIGNLGIDLIVLALARLLPLETAASVAGALVPALGVAGIYALARAVHGRVPATALLALMFIWTFTLSYGFENYHLSLALALLGAAAWIRLASAGAALRWLVMVPVSAIVLLAHASGWGVLGLVVLGWEWAAQRAETPLRRLVHILWRMAPLAVPGLGLVFWRQEAQGTQGLVMSGPLTKLRFLWDMFRAETIWLDRLLLLVTVSLLAWLLLRLWRGRSAGMLIAAGLLLLTFLLMPHALLGSYFADQRLLPALAIILVLALPVPDGRMAARLAVIALLLFGVRMAELSLGWWQRGHALAAELVALDHVPRGGRVAAMARMSNCGGGVLHGYDHLANFVITRRDGFANTQWDVAGAQLVRPIYNRDHGYNDDGSVFIRDARDRRCYGRELDAMVDGLPRERFDFVWTFDAPVERAWLVPVFQGTHGRLYRIVRTPDQTDS
jgi:hypothetical protein